MSEIESNPEKRIALFQRKEIRRVIHNNEWWFVITDVVAALTDSANPQGYIKDMRRRDPQFAEALKGGGKLPPPFSFQPLVAGKS
jgi:DNA-damage-inducible protein D